MNRKFGIIPSEEAVKINSMLEKQTVPEIVRDYQNLSIIPYGETVSIIKLGGMNFDFMERKHLGLIKYGDFRAFYPNEYPVATDPLQDYTFDDQVTPVRIITDKGTFRVSHILWFPLTDIISGILLKQFQINKKLLPIEVFIDQKNQWLCKLFNLVGHDIISNLKSID
ncbi:uncharacterized protein LOC126903547 isoform X2 [Daktulosphaira vitifoliae]|nr:uncharacterized protein LOC126903547 isoform X2 [Daktulosphaira vitifoliae]XP_050537703.1 uncharacterized protein LOC126903547 isoform X2 [Daktulosphaira vitifoliae]XP_050537704.1 uncharacterized protein LOC126903547 isoform X2 [Daktulosphaira vitifoliae]